MLINPPSNISTSKSRGTLFLVTGDSPIGVRLPLDSLPWLDPETVEHEFETDPFVPLETLPPQVAIRRQHEHRENDVARTYRPIPDRDVPAGDGLSDPVRTALKVEILSERKELAAQLPAPILADYDRILRARAGLALVPVAKPNFCGACRMTITPQRLQELRAQSSLIPCESCGRYLYWPS